MRALEVGTVDWGLACRLVEFTPERYREPISLALAGDIFRCEPDELEPIFAAGLPVDREAGTVDAFDAINVGLYSRSRATAPELQMQALKNVIRPGPTSWVRDVSWTVNLTAACDGCPDPGAPWQEVSGGEGSGWSRRPEVGPAGGPVFSRVIHGGGCEGRIVSPIVARVVDDALAGLRFQYAPEEWDRDRSPSQLGGTTSCLGSSLLLADRLEAEGYEVAIRSGILVGLARVTKHNWLEVVDDDGEVKCIDSALALVAPDFLLPAFRPFCLGGRFNRLVEVDWAGKPSVVHLCTDPPAITVDDAYVRPVRRSPVPDPGGDHRG